MTKAEFEKRVQELIGHRIARVRYHEIDYQNAEGEPLAEPQWNWCSDFDSLDYGLDLTMEDDSVFHITWGAEFTQYGLTVQHDPLHDVSAVRVWDVTESSRWAPLTGQRIKAAEVYWSWFELADGSQRTEYPQDIRLTFEHGDFVYLSAYEVRDGGFRMGMMDHITVFFGDTSAKTYGIGPFASTDRAA